MDRQRGLHEDLRVDLRVDLCVDHDRQTCCGGHVRHDRDRRVLLVLRMDHRGVRRDHDDRDGCGGHGGRGGHAHEARMDRLVVKMGLVGLVREMVGLLVLRLGLRRPR